MTLARACQAVIGGLTLLLAAPAAAEPMSLEAALSRAYEVSTPLRLQELSSEAAEAAWLSDPRVGAPSIRFGVRDIYPATGDPTDPSAPPEVVARIRFPFPRPWDLAAATRQGAATVERETAELQDLQAELSLAVTSRFHALPLLRRATQLSAELCSLREQHLTLVEERRNEGLATGLDWLEAEEERRDADDDRARREAALNNLEWELRLLLDWPDTEPLELVEAEVQERAEAPLPSEDDLLNGLMQRSPEARRAEAQIERSEARLHRLRLRSVPWLDWVQGGTVIRPGRDPSFEVGVAVDVPMYHWSAARTRAARSELSRARLELEDVRRASAHTVVRRLRSAAAARERWMVEEKHLSALQSRSAPLLEVADPLLQVDLAARVTRARLRAVLALVELVQQLDRLHAQAHLSAQ